MDFSIDTVSKENWNNFQKLVDKNFRKELFITGRKKLTIKISNNIIIVKHYMAKNRKMILKYSIYVIKLHICRF